MGGGYHIAVILGDNIQYYTPLTVILQCSDNHMSYYLTVLVG